MKKRNGMMIKELLCMGVFSTIVMDIGEETVKALYPIIESMQPQYLGRWILYMFQGVFIQNDIIAVVAIGIEIPVSLLVHYLTGIILVVAFLLLRKNYKIFSSSIFAGMVFGWITLVIPWFFFYPCIGFGFMGLDTPEGINNIVYSIIYHSFYGLGITLWLGWIRKFIIKDSQ